MAFIYVPKYLTGDVKARVETLTTISKIVVQSTGIRPTKVLPVSEEALYKSVLGKLLRSQIKKVFYKVDNYNTRSKTRA